MASRGTTATWAAVEGEETTGIRQQQQQEQQQQELHNKQKKQQEQDAREGIKATVGGCRSVGGQENSEERDGFPPNTGLSNTTTYACYCAEEVSGRSTSIYIYFIVIIMIYFIIIKIIISIAVTTIIFISYPGLQEPEGEN